MKYIISIVLSFCLSSQVFAESWSGSGFFISRFGHIATAGHVVKGATHLFVKYHGKFYPATIVAADYRHDSAIIHIDVKGTWAYSFNTDIGSGDTIYILGYPIPRERGLDLKVSKGRIKYVGSQLHMEASSCQGNSGGPVTNDSGQVVGILISGMPMYNNGECSWATQAANNYHVIALARQAGVPISVSNSRDGSYYTQGQVHEADESKNVTVYIIGTNE